MQLFFKFKKIAGKGILEEPIVHGLFLAKRFENFLQRRNVVAPSSSGREEVMIFRVKESDHIDCREHHQILEKEGIKEELLTRIRRGRGRASNINLGNNRMVI